MEYKHVVCNEKGDFVGRIQHPQGYGFNVPVPFFCIGMDLNTDEEYDMFYNLPVFDDIIDYGYMGH